MDLIQAFTNEQLKKEIPVINIGDTVRVHNRIKEGNRERIQMFEGTLEGEIAHVKSGNGGFGYDPIFIPQGYNNTFANLPAEVKNSISHRAKAISALKKVLQK